MPLLEERQAVTIADVQLAAAVARRADPRRAEGG